MSRGRRSRTLYALAAVAGTVAVLATSNVASGTLGGKNPAAPPAAAYAATTSPVVYVATSKVPKVVTTSSGWAVKRLQAAGYQVYVGKPRYDGNVKKYYVSSQVLSPGAYLKKGRTVTIYPSLGAKPVYNWKRAAASTYGGPSENQSVAGPYPSTRKLEKRGVMYFAHKSMKFGTKVLFAYNGRTVIAICVDRGPYVHGRDFDLGRNTADALRFGGVHKVSWTVVK